MQAQDRFARLSTRPIAFGAAALVALALALLALVLFTAALRSAQPPTPRAQVAIAQQQGPDAQERNDAYARALASRFDNQSPDAKERNIQLSGR
jgi:hypothetical protein